MVTLLPPTPEVALAGQDGGERFLEDLRRRVPAELVLAEEAPLARSIGDGLDALAQDWLTDPCHLLRRACQIADYGATSSAPPPSEPRLASR